MARQKKQKEPIKLRFKKLANGNQSIYLDYYQNGKREYDFLQMYIVPVVTPFDKLQNEETLRAANAIKSQKIIDLTNGKAGIKSNKSRLLLADWMEKYIEQKKISKKRHKLYISVQNAVLSYTHTAKLADIDVKFVKDFFLFLQTYGRKNKTIKASTAKEYANIFSNMLNEAVRAGIMDKNPFSMLSPADKIKVKREELKYLSKEEVLKLMATPCRHEQVKQAFLFACFIGLRLSDVMQLKWQDVQTDGDQYKIVKRQQKTGEIVYLPLPVKAVEYMPVGNDANIFSLPSRTTIGKTLKEWARMAGIKDITFHTSRHTFATMLLSEDVNLAVVSKMLGHAEIRTTQIYAEIMDKKKAEAANKLDDLFK